MVFAAWLRKPYTITPASLTLGDGGSNSSTARTPAVAYAVDPLTLAPETLRARCFSDDNPLRLSASAMAGVAMGG